jgi:hypothetical protein
MAGGSLSPNRVAQKLREHRQAVMVLARRAAIKEIKVKLRAQGIRLTLVLPKDINVLANDYLAQHGEQLRAEAEHAIATWPGFARWRLPCADIKTNEQTQGHCSTS